MSSSNLPPFDHMKSMLVTQSPNLTWSFAHPLDSTPEGKKWVEGMKSGWKTVDTSKETPRSIYTLLKSGIEPRPIAFVSSISPDGVENLAPYSWFNQISAIPPIISISCTSIPAFLEGVKDTPRNIMATKEFTMNIVSEAWAEQANAVCTTSPLEVSEWELTGLTKEPSTQVKPARVKESAFSMECELLQAIPVPLGAPQPSSTLILGNVKFIHVRNDVLDENGDVDPVKMRAISKMGSILYARTAEGFDLPRTKWEDIKDDVERAVRERKGL